MEVDVLEERVRILKAQLEMALQQRDRFMQSYHVAARIPFAERHEILTECNEDLQKLKGPATD